MSEKETIVLSRNVDIVTIPDGLVGMLREGDGVTIHQALGDNFTVLTSYGHLVRIAGKDADALGQEPHELKTLSEATNFEAIEKNCWEMMRTVYDPEIPVNVVELGLIYGCDIKILEDGNYAVHVKMTLTAPGCGMGAVIQGDIETGIKNLAHVSQVNVEIVLDPPWSREMMSEVAQLQLGLF